MGGAEEKRRPKDEVRSPNDEQGGRPEGEVGGSAPGEQKIVEGCGARTEHRRCQPVALASDPNHVAPIASPVLPRSCEIFAGIHCLEFKQSWDVLGPPAHRRRRHRASCVDPLPLPSPTSPAATVRRHVANPAGPYQRHPSSILPPSPASVHHPAALPGPRPRGQWSPPSPRAGSAERGLALASPDASALAATPSAGRR